MTIAILMLASLGAGALMGAIAHERATRADAEDTAATPLGADWYAVRVRGKTECWRVDSLARETHGDRVGEVLRITREDGQGRSGYTDSLGARWPELRQVLVAHRRAIRLRTLTPPPSDADRALKEAADLLAKLNHAKGESA